MVVDDFNHDKILDRALNYGSLVQVMLGKGDGTFTSGKFVGVSTMDAIVAGDFNHDGNPDLAVTTNQFSRDGVAIFLGKGDGSFGAPVLTSVDLEGVALATADFDGDGNADLVVGGFESSHILVLLGNGDGTFPSQASYWTNLQYAGALVTADINKDHLPDILSVDEFGNCVSVLLNNSAGGSGSIRAGGGSPVRLVN